MKKILTVIIFVTLCSACSLGDPISKAQIYIQKGNYTEAIKTLEKEFKSKPKSIPIKSLLAKTYSDYGLALCQDTAKEPKIRYGLAKEQFAMALELNPYLTDAKEMYEMIVQIQEAFQESENIQSENDLNMVDDEIAKAKAKERIESEMTQ